jgi:cell division protein FtsB
VRRLPLVLLGVVAVVALGVLSSIVTQGFRDLRRAEAERDRLMAEKEDLEQRIAALEATLEAIHSDADAREAFIRRELGWIRPGEQVVFLTTPTPAPDPATLTAEAPTPILTLPD